MKPEELKILKTCYELMQKIESSTCDGSFSESDLMKISMLLKSFEFSENSDLQKLSAIPEHFFPSMRLRHFSNFVIPVERLLQKSIKDDDFLITSVDKTPSPQAKAPLYFVLDNIRSAFNVGSIFRLADCLNIAGIFLCGYTATPENPLVQKTAMGSFESTTWEHFEKLEDSMQALQKLNINIYALETAQNSQSLFDCKFTSPAALLVGNERFGLTADALKQCQQVISIPTFGTKNSLNVANALSITSYEWKRQWS